MQEQWTHWEPIKGLTGTYVIEMLAERQFGLVITLYSYRDKHQKIEIVFRPADSYKRTNASFKIRISPPLSDKYEDSFYTQWTFFKLTGSEYLFWLKEESCEVYNNFDFQHFCIVDENSVIDILAREEPQVRIIVPPKD